MNYKKWEINSEQTQRAKHGKWMQQTEGENEKQI